MGVVRLILENKIHMPLFQILNASRSVYGDSAQSAVAEAMTESEKRNENGEPTVLVNWSVRQMISLMNFIAERLKVLMKDKGVRHDYIAAVYGLAQSDNLDLIDLCRVIARVGALTKFLSAEDGANLLTAFRRAANIVRIEEGKDKCSYRMAADKSLFKSPEEGSLFDALEQVVLNSSKKIASDDFEGAMEDLAKLRVPVDAFFEKVQVNCDDVQLRTNRLRMLSMIVGAMSGVADFSVIEG